MSTGDPYPNALPSGTVLDDLTIVSVIEQGSFGITYLARQGARGVRCAVKEFFPERFVRRDGNLVVVPRKDADLTLLADSLRAFQRESALLEAFHHPNVVDVKGYKEAFGTVYSVMRLVDGQTLSRLLKDTGGTLPQASVLAIATAMAPALDALHAAGIIHRDIKPGNIMLRADGSPVLVDFGAALSLARDDAAATPVFVTPGYSAPEQITASSEQGAASDIYSFSAVIFKALTGATPPDALERLEGHAPDLAGGLCGTPVPDALLRGLALEVRDRPRSAVALVADLASQLRSADHVVSGRRAPEAGKTPFLLVPKRGTRLT